MNIKPFLTAFALLWMLAGNALHAQTVHGEVMERDEKGRERPVEGATVYLTVAKTGQLTNAQGQFSLPYAGPDTLIARYLGYKDDTVIIKSGGDYDLLFTELIYADSITIRARLLPSYISMITPMQVELISEDELTKSACCNLSESFSTNGSVEVNESDAVTGSKEIRLLGLAGRYSPVTTERRATVRGLGYLYGLNWIPGSWIQGIQISKGTGSVTDTYESMTGEVNVELKQPETAEKLLLNLYGNQFGRGEINLVTGHRLGKRWSTALLGHASASQFKFDQNHDHFLNMPLYKLVTGVNRWKWEGPHNACIQFGVRGLYEDREGGEIHFNKKTDKGTTNAYGFGMVSRRVEAFAKAGWVAKERSWRSFGSIFNYFYHDQDAFFGITDYTGQQHYFKASLLYNDIIGDTRHKYYAGLNFQLDDVHEQVNDTVVARNEKVAGAFFEYSFTHFEKLLIVAGLRGDYNNLYGFAPTPRLHVRWSPKPTTTVRFSGGYGYRTPTVIAENMSVLTSSRRLIFEERILQEKSWTFGLNLVQKFTLAGREGSFSVDAYRTTFTNQLVTDMETPAEVRFYNLRGSSFSNVAQAEVNWEIIERLDLKIAFRILDVRATINDSLQEMPLNPKQRGLINLSWKNKTEKWQLDFTASYTGVQRIPDTKSNPEIYQLPSHSKAFAGINAQVSRKFNRLELYVGGENLTNFMQHEAIIAPNDPFGPYFDSSLVWGPMMGRQVYGGLRYIIEQKQK